MSGIQYYPVISGQLASAAARSIASLESACLPNLSHALLVLPNFHAAREVGVCLQKAAGGRPLALPRFETFRSLAGAQAQTQTGLGGLLPSSRRQSLIYQALRERAWFPRSELWHVSAELLALFDEMTLHKVRLPDSEAGFLAQLEKAYQSGQGNAALQFESRLVFELWHAMLTGNQVEADEAARYQMQLASLLSSLDTPLYVLGTNGLLPVELDFLERYAQRTPVICFVEDAAQAAPGSFARLLETCWPPAGQDTPMHERANKFKPPAFGYAQATFRQAQRVAAGEGANARGGGFNLSGVADSPAANRIHLHSAHGLEHEASACASQIGQWLAQGKSAIAIVAQDRLAARRMRALLERDQVLVQDETGWTLSTTSASTVLMRWLDNLDSRFHHQDLLDFLKSPFVLAGWTPERRKLGVFALEQAIRRHSVVSGLKRYRSLLGHAPEALELLDALRRAQLLFPQGKAQRLSKWIASLLDSLTELHVVESLRHDPAGAQLLALLDGLRAELAQDAVLFEYGEWRKWMNLQFEAAVFRDDEVSSPVIFTHLGACRLRQFDAVAIVGADAAHLPSAGRKSIFFNQSVRGHLGLKDRSATLEIERQDLISLLASCESVWVSWQSRKNGEPNALSPWLERLDVFHRLAFGISLIQALPIQEAGLPEMGWPETPVSYGIPVPNVPSEQLPTRLSVSAYNSLVACPYQFFARHALHLNELDEVSVALEKRDYGEYVHAILHRFHAAHPVLGESAPADLQAALQDISQAVFQQATEADFISQAWLLRWQDNIPGYNQWQIEREAQGWRWQAGELKASRQIPLPGAAPEAVLELHGRLDRVDRYINGGGDGAAVLDYKTQTSISLKKKLESVGEDVQLPCYALLMDDMPMQALFVAVDETPVKSVGDDLDIAGLAEANLARLQEMFAAMHQGAGLPAQGVNAVCQYCEMRGLCRKDYWHV